MATYPVVPLLSQNKTKQLKPPNWQRTGKRADMDSRAGGVLDLPGKCSHQDQRLMSRKGSITVPMTFVRHAYRCRRAEPWRYDTAIRNWIERRDKLPGELNPLRNVAEREAAP